MQIARAGGIHHRDQIRKETQPRTLPIDITADQQAAYVDAQNADSV